MPDIDPQSPKDALDGVIASGWKIVHWGMNFRDKKLTIDFEEPKTAPLEPLDKFGFKDPSEGLIKLNKNFYGDNQ